MISLWVHYLTNTPLYFVLLSCFLILGSCYIRGSATIIFFFFRDINFMFMITNIFLYSNSRSEPPPRLPHLPLYYPSSPNLLNFNSRVFLNDRNWENYLLRQVGRYHRYHTLSNACKGLEEPTKGALQLRLFLPLGCTSVPVDTAGVNLGVYR